MEANFAKESLVIILIAMLCYNVNLVLVICILDDGYVKKGMLSLQCLTWSCSQP